MTQSPKFLLTFALLFATNCLADTPTPLNPKVVPMKMEKNDVADALDMIMWKFQVITKKPNTRIVLRLSFLPTNTNYQVPGDVDSYMQKSTKAEILVAMYEQSDGIHYVLRNPEGKTTFVQPKNQLEGWRRSYTIKNGLPLATRMGDGYKLFDFTRAPADATIQQTETLNGVFTVEQMDR